MYGMGGLDTDKIGSAGGAAEEHPALSPSAFPHQQQHRYNYGQQPSQSAYTTDPTNTDPMADPTNMADPSLVDALPAKESEVDSFNNLRNALAVCVK
jgi:hypothetical protein